MLVNISINDLSEGEKVELIEELFDDLDCWQSVDGFALIEHLALTKLTDDEISMLTGMLVHRFPEKVIEQTKNWNTESVGFLGYKINKEDFLEWLEKKYANCYVTSFAGDDIELKIREFIKENNK